MAVILTGLAIAASGLLGGALGGFLAGGSKKEQTQKAGQDIYAPTITEPFAQYSPSYQMDYQYAPTVQIESPGATGATQTTKKESTQTPTLTVIPTVSPSIDQAQKQEDGNLIEILIIGGLAIGGLYVLTRRKK